MTTGPMPAYVTVYEPGDAGTLGALFASKPRTALLARLCATGGQLYYRPILRGTLADVAEVAATLARIDQLPTATLSDPLSDVIPDPDAAPGGRREPEPEPAELA